MKNQQTHPLGWGWDCHFWARILRECFSLWCKAMLSNMSAQLTTAQWYQTTTIQQRSNHWPHYTAPCAPRNNPRGTRQPWKHSRNKLSPNRNQEVYVLLCQLKRMVVEYVAWKSNDWYRLHSPRYCNEINFKFPRQQRAAIWAFSLQSDMWPAILRSTFLRAHPGTAFLTLLKLRNAEE